MAYSFDDLPGIVSRIGLQSLPHKYIGRTFQFNGEKAEGMIVFGGLVTAWGVFPTKDGVLFTFFTNIPIADGLEGNNVSLVAGLAATDKRIDDSDWKETVWDMNVGSQIFLPGKLVWMDKS